MNTRKGTQSFRQETHWPGIHKGLDQSTLFAGFSAQNVQTAIPEAVGSSTNGYLTLQDRPVIAAVVNAIKEIATISGVFKANLITWLGSATNGITKVVAGEIDSPLICATDANGKTCMTRAQLDALLAASAVPASAPAPTLTTASSTLTLNGNNPTQWQLNMPWSDNLGALFTHDGQMETIYATTSVDTSTSGTTTIQYWAQVPSTQVWLSITREVEVVDPMAASSSSTPPAF